METLIATATFGLEAVVSRELAALGYEARGTRPGWLRFQGDRAAIARTNLWLRAADRVFVEMSSFQAADFGVLFDATRATEWERFLPKNARFPVRGRSVRSKLASVPACQRIVKKAIVERLRDAYGTQEITEDGPTFAVEVAIVNDEAALLLDTSGAGLHRRGYRPVTGLAPLKETLAAGLLQLSFWNRERPFLDPFCGTGTLPIEAALIATNRAPGLDRSFDAEAWPDGADAWARARDEARSLRADEEVLIEGSDVDETALSMATAHAHNADVAHAVRFETRAFADIASDASFGCIVTNPPYGERLGDRDEARALYQTFANVLRRFPTWSHYVLTSFKELESVLGQAADRRRKLYNGRIECTYFQFHGPRPGRASSDRSFGGVGVKGDRQVELFSNRLKKRAHHMRKWPMKRRIEAYRLYDRDIKEVPLTVDRYGPLVLITPPVEPVTSRTQAEQEDWLDAMADAVSRTLGVTRDAVFVAGRSAPERRAVIREDDFSFEVRLDGTGETGLPIAARGLRRKLSREAAGKRILACASGAGTYAVAAARGGARSVTCVDDDADWVRRNLSLNELAEERVTIVSAVDDRERYDLAVTDDEAFNTAETYFISHGSRRPEGAVEVTDELLPEEFRSRRRVRFWKLSRAE